MIDLAYQYVGSDHLAEVVRCALADFILRSRLVKPSIGRDHSPPRYCVHIEESVGKQYNTAVHFIMQRWHVVDTQAIA
jgi:hypothetical protein